MLAHARKLTTHGHGYAVSRLKVSRDRAVLRHSVEGGGVRPFPRHALGGQSLQSAARLLGDSGGFYSACSLRSQAHGTEGYGLGHMSIPGSQIAKSPFLWYSVFVALSDCQICKKMIY